MENLDLTIATIIVSISFIVFGIATYKEFSEAAKNDIKRQTK